MNVHQAQSTRKGPPEIMVFGGPGRTLVTRPFTRDHVAVPSIEAAAEDLQDAAALWSISALRADAVVTAACDALVAGLDSPSLRTLAACFHNEADYEVPEILPTALEELGLVYYPPDSQAGQEAAARALAFRHLAGTMTARELAFETHRHFSHSLPLTERLAELDDEYDILEYSGRTAAQVDDDVTAEALRLAQHRRLGSAEPAGTSPSSTHTNP
jgi:hypothetical protein